MLPTGNNHVDIGCPLEVVIRQEDDSIGLPVYLTNDAALKSLSLGFRCNSAVAEITGLDTAGTIVPDAMGLIYKLVPGENKLLLGYIGLDDISPQEEGLLATLWITITGGTPEQTIDLDSTFVSPAGEFIFSASDGGTIIPDYYDCGSSEIAIINYICGDADADNSVDMLDILFLISYLYKGGPAPEPTESADVNHDGSVNMLDILYSINYLYKGGPEPLCT
jgi:hypothetical protein